MVPRKSPRNPCSVYGTFQEVVRRSAPGMWDRDHTQWHSPSNITSQDLKRRVELEEKAEAEKTARAGKKAGAKIVPTLLPSLENIVTGKY